MSKKDEALKMALAALEESLGYVEEEAENAQRLYGQYPTRQARIQGLKDDARKHMDAIAAIRSALAEKPAQPCTYPTCPYPCPDLPDCRDAEKAAQQQEPPTVAELLCVCGAEWEWRNRDWELVATPQPTQQQEPGAWMKPHPKCDSACLYQCTHGFTRFPECATSPQPSKPWVGLTDAEWMNIVNKDHAWFGQRPEDVAHEVAKLVEAKLKEKNHG